jgi:Bacterial archaeo-eukaryotic release factor family 10
VEHSERATLLRRLIEWRSETGILTVYVDLDPGDRGRPWRIALREQLHQLEERTDPHSERRAFEGAAGEILERFPENGAPPEGRGHVGFIELAEKRPTTVWRSMQLAPRRTEVTRSARPYIRPLVELFAEGPHVGAVLVSADRVRLLDWSLGAIRELDDWEITLFDQDWREGKAERSIPGRGTGPSASGHDRFSQRLDANRRRFLHEIAGIVAREQSKRSWRDLLVFGTEDLPRDFAANVGNGTGAVHTFQHDLVSSRESQVAERVEAEVRELNTARAMELVGEIEEAIGAGPGAALGTQETLQALAEGRARHLVFSGEQDFEGLAPADLAYDDGREDLPVGERLVQLAVATDATVTPVYEEPASKLESHEGVAALLRY